MARFAVPLPATVVFDYPTVAALARAVAQQAQPVAAALALQVGAPVKDLCGCPRLMGRLGASRARCACPILRMRGALTGWQ